MVETKDALLGSLDIPILNFSLDIALGTPKFSDFAQFMGLEAAVDLKPSCQEIATQLLEPFDRAQKKMPLNYGLQLQAYAASFVLEGPQLIELRDRVWRHSFEFEIEELEFPEGEIPCIL